MFALLLYVILLLVKAPCSAFSPSRMDFQRPLPLSSTGTSLSAAIEPVSIGFVGCGTIAKAIAIGFATQEAVPIASIAVSRRSESRSSWLAENFPKLVTVHDDNQEVADKADVIFVAVLPQQTSQVLKDLKFDNSRHTLVSLVSTSNLNGLARDSGLPTENVFKMICLPAVAEHQGLCLVTPSREHAVLLALLNSLGGYVQAEDERQMSCMMVPSGLMGSLYGILRNNRDWLIEQGVDKSKANYLVTRYYWGMIQDANRLSNEPCALDELVSEQTPGGLNEQALRNLESLGTLENYNRVQDALLARVLGQSDGSLAGDA